MPHEDTILPVLWEAFNTPGPHTALANAGGIYPEGMPMQSRPARKATVRYPRPSILETMLRAVHR